MSAQSTPNVHATKHEQEPSFLIPGITLDGQNKMAAALATPLPSNSYDAHRSEENLSYKQFISQLKVPASTPPPNPAITDSLIICDPPVLVPDYQKLIIPPTPTTRLPEAGKVVLIVGASKGLGLACALFLKPKGYTVIGTSRNPEAYDELAASVLCKTPLNIKSDRSIETFFAREIAPLGRLDILILCAGTHFYGRAADSLSRDDMKSFFDVKPFGYQACIKAAVPFMRQNPNGRVLCMSSIAGGGEWFVGPFLSQYSIVNHALSMMTKCYNADERALRRRGLIENPITYVSIIPGIIASTIGSYNYHKSSSLAYDEATVRAAHLVIAAIQLGLFAPLYPADSPLFVAQQVYDIISAPQPYIKYHVGDPASFYAAVGLTPIQVMNEMERMSEVDQVNYEVVNTDTFFSTPVLELARNGLLTVFNASP